MWVDNAFRAIGEFFGWLRQKQDPEVIRQAKIAELDGKITVLRKKIKEKLREKVHRHDQEGFEQYATELGALVDNYTSLVQERKRHQR